MRQESKAHRIYLAIALIVALLAVACGSNGTTATDDDTAAPGTDETETSPAATDTEQARSSVRFMIPALVTGPAQAPLGPLQAVLGYFEEENLDVEIMRLDGSGEVVQAVSAGQTDMGNASTGTYLAAIEAGEDIISFYTHLTGSALLPAVPADGEIQEVSQMRGATIGVPSLSSGLVPLITALLGEEGIGADEVEFVAVGRGADVAEVIRQGSIDVVGLSDADHAALEGLGIELNIVSHPLFENLGFQSQHFSTREWAEDNRHAIVGFHRAMAKALAFADENPEAVVRLNWAMFPGSKPTGMSEEEALAAGVTALEARNPNTAPVDGVWGQATDEQIMTAQEVFRIGEVITQEFEPEEVFTREYLDEINDFDEEAVREQARNFNMDDIPAMVAELEDGEY